MSSRPGIRQYVRRFAAVGLASIIGLMGVQLFFTHRVAKRDVGERADILARQASHAVDHVLEERRSFLERMSRRLADAGQVRSDDFSCPGWFPVGADVFRSTTNLVLVSPRGRTLCSSLPSPEAGPVDYGDRRWFREAAERRRFYVGDARSGRHSGTWSLALAQPVLSQDGELRGVLALGLDLVRMADALTEIDLPTGAELEVTHRGGTMVRRGGDDSMRVSVVREGDPTEDTEGVVGEFRSEISGWRCRITLPQALVWSRLRRGALEDGLLAMFLLGFGVLLAAWLRSQIEEPLKELARRIRSEGPEGVPHLELQGPAEIDLVSRSFRKVLEMREAMEAQLRELSRVVEQMSDLVVITDEEQKIVYVNPAFEALTGYTPEEAMGRPVDFLEAEPDELDVEPTEETSSEVERRPEEERIPKGPYSGRGLCRKSDGDTFLVERTVSRIRDADGCVLGWAVIGRDVSARQELELRVREAEKRDVVGRLAGSIAHTFANLFTVIAGGLELVRTGLSGEDLPALEGRVEEIAEASDVGSKLVRRLLSLSYRHVEVPERVDLGALVESNRETLRHLIPEPVELSVATPDEARAWTVIDPISVIQMLLGLVTNAAQAMGSAGRVAVTVVGPSEIGRWGVEQGGWVGMSVEDNGPGMTPEVRARIFEPFFTTKEDALGLGLTILAEGVEEVAGRIDVETAPGRGTTVRVILPYQPSEEDPPPRGPS